MSICREPLTEYAPLGHPYVADYSLSTSLNWVLTMSPIMAEVMSKAEFLEVDITYKASVEIEYLFNAVTFNYTTMKCEHKIKTICSLLFTGMHTYVVGMTVGRVHLNSLNTEAYAQCFWAIFETVSKYYPKYSVEKSLHGILMDWSDQQYNGLEQVVGEDIAKAIVKGCQVITHKQSDVS